MDKLPDNWRIEQEWAIDGQWAIRYYNPVSHKELQISKYRGADEFDKAMKQSYDWHNKWYVDEMSSYGKKPVQLFDTKSQAMAYAKKFMLKHRVK